MLEEDIEQNIPINNSTEKTESDEKEKLTQLEESEVTQFKKQTTTVTEIIEARLPEIDQEENKDSVDEVSKILEKYSVSENRIKNVESAKQFIGENFKHSPKDVVDEIINYYVKVYFNLSREDCTNVKSFWARITREESKAAKESGRAAKEAERKAKKACKEVEKAAARETMFSPHIGFDIVADCILQSHFIFTMDDTREFYIYENGVYSNEGTETKVKRLARETYLELYREAYERTGKEPPSHIEEPGKKFTEEVLEKVRIDTAISRSEIDYIQWENLYLINLKNGVYDIINRRLLPHSPAYKMIRQIPVEYDPNADCPQIMKFLSEVVSPQDKLVLIEFAGYILIPDTKTQKAILLYGSGANGKSIFLRMLGEFIGERNTSHESLQNLEQDKFSVANLYSKLVNIYADLRSSILEYDDMFKTIVGGDELRGERKYQHAFSFKNTSRLIFSANTQNIPIIKKDDFAFFRRWILIEFTSQFLEAGEKEGAKVDDKGLFEKLTTPAELSGFLNHAIEGLLTVLQNGKYSYTKSISDVEKVYKLNSSSVGTFAESCLITSIQDTEKDEMYRTYCAWAGAKGVKVVPPNVFGKELKRLGYTSDRPYDRVLQKKYSVWENVMIDQDKLYFEMTGKKQQKTPECFVDDYLEPDTSETKIPDPNSIEW